MSGRHYLAALLFTAVELAGCSLVEQVIVIEPRKEAQYRKEALKPSGTLSRGTPIASREIKAASTRTDGKVYSGEVISKANSARYDSGPVLKPIKKTPENKTVEVGEDSAFVSAVRNWIKTGMQLPGWAGHK